MSNNDQSSRKKRVVMSVPVTAAFRRVRSRLKREAKDRGLSEADIAREKIAQAYEPGKVVAV